MLHLGLCTPLQRSVAQKSVVLQAVDPPGVRQMAHWYPLDHQMLQQQQQQQQQLGQHSALAYGALPHLACMLPPAYPPVQYAYSSMPVTVNGVQHVWVPWKINCDPAPYAHYGQMHLPHSSSVGQQIPYSEGRRPAAVRSSHHSDPLQMAWPDSPTTAQSSNHHLQQGSTQGATPRQQISRRASPNCVATPSQPLLPADNPQGPQQPSSAVSDQLAPISLSDDLGSSYSTASPSRPNAAGTTSTSVKHHASSESTTSAEGVVCTGRATQDTQNSMAVAARDEHVVDGPGPAWQWLTLGLLRDVMAELPPHCRKRCRLVCKRWQTTVDMTVQVATLPRFLSENHTCTAPPFLHLHCHVRPLGLLRLTYLCSWVFLGRMFVQNTSVCHQGIA